LLAGGPDQCHILPHEALKALAEIDEQRALIVELPFFGGMTINEVAEVLGIAESTVRKRWGIVRIWLRRYLSENAAS
jgi:DNA-directed RNA polymerase specialized sigma subunit